MKLTLSVILIIYALLSGGNEALGRNLISTDSIQCSRFSGSIEGNLFYDNNNLTPIAGIELLLMDAQGQVVGRDTTDSLGHYSWPSLGIGSYTLISNMDYNPGGINATDALQVSRFFASIISLSPLRIKAADASGNSIVNASDALLISRRSAGLSTTFGSGAFVEWPSQIMVGTGSVDPHWRILSTGDVNGSFVPVPNMPQIILDTVIVGGASGSLGQVSVMGRVLGVGTGVFRRGVCWSTNSMPTLLDSVRDAGLGTGAFSLVLSNLPFQSSLNMRAFGMNSLGITYSNVMSFGSLPGVRCPGLASVTDTDGNLYHTVQIGSQCWIQNELRTTRYRNGESLLANLNASDWVAASSGAWCYYNDDPTLNTVYGKLYNWFAVNDARGLCPSGWHVPSNSDWLQLINGQGGGSLAGSSLKGNVGWNAPNAGANNSTGFSAVGGGFRSSSSGNYFTLGLYGNWWTSSVFFANGSSSHRLYAANTSVLSGFQVVTTGLSVRCLRD